MTDWNKAWQTALTVLKSLPGIKFALLLGAGMVVTVFAVVFTCILAGWWVSWPAEAALERVRWLGIGLCICLGLIGVLMMVLGGIKLDRVSVTTAMGSGEIDLTHDPVDEVR